MSTNKPRVHYCPGPTFLGACGETARVGKIDIAQVTCRVCRRRYFSLERDRRLAQERSRALRDVSRGRA